jgi:acetyltransferase-like isoleucine patch superfamily enzyme
MNTSALSEQRVVTGSLILLGFCPTTIPIILETAKAAWGITDAMVYENMERAAELPAYLPNGFSLKAERWTGQSLPGDAIFHLGVSGTFPKWAVTNFFQQEAGIAPDSHVTLVHPQAVVFASAALLPGCFIEPGTVISSFARLGYGVSVKRGATIGHHVALGNYVNINPGATICGQVTIGHATIIGAGAVVSDGVTIGSNCMIGAGSVVVKNIPDNVVAFGNPCKVMKGFEGKKV